VNDRAINLESKFGLFSETWQPMVIAEMNDYQFKIARLEGDFIWHHHEDTDEAFLVLEGDLRIDFRERVGPPRTGRALYGSEGQGT
jgi:mannose-6-phosphate isomerase-like protein (cupin superfamily)